MRFKEEIVSGDISFSPEVPYITQGESGQIIAPSSQFDDVRTKIVQPIFSNPNVDGGQGSNLPPIIVKDPKYLGTENADFQGFFFIKSNIDKATIFLNGENTYKTTPETLKIFASDILKSKGPYVITLVKDGYSARERYEISVISNRNPIEELTKPSFDYSINGYDSYLYRNDVIARDRIVKPDLVYTDTPRYVFSITKITKDGSTKAEPADPLNAELDFTLDTTKPTDTDAKNYYSLSITTQNPDAVKISYIAKAMGVITTPEQSTITEPVTRLTGKKRPFGLPPTDEITSRRNVGLFGLNRLRKKSIESDENNTSFGVSRIDSNDIQRNGIFRRRKPDILDDVIIPTNLDLIKTPLQEPSNNFIKLSDGQNVITIPTGATLNIESADINRFRITGILIEGETKDYEPLTAEPGKSIKTSIEVESNLKLSVQVEEIPQLVVVPQKISLVNPEVTRKYNKNSGNPVPIGLYVLGKLQRLKVYVNKKEYTFTEFEKFNTRNDIEDAIMIALPPDAFTILGNYKVILVPFFEDSPITGPIEGQKLELIYQVVAEAFVNVPDIFDITYPKEITPPDYVGTDVNFIVSFKSRDTQYVKIFYGESFQRVGESGNIQLNVKSVLEKLGNKVIETDDSITFTLKLIPYAESGNETIAGKEEIFSVKFNKSKLLIPRAVALSRISDSFSALFNETKMEDESSKYLTHLLHLGDGNNKIITTWTGSKDSLILKLYEPIGTNVQPNDLVWISKPQTNPIIETVTLVSNPVTVCTPIKGPNFSLEVNDGIGFAVYDELIASGSLSSNSLINKITSGSLIDTTKLDIQYASGSEMLFNNFVNFSSAEERINNFYYKVQLIEVYQNRYNSIITGSASSSLSVYTEAKKYLNSIDEIKNNFDGFENFLYTDTLYSESLSYPKNSNGSLKNTTSNDSVAWLYSLTNLANTYDRENPNNLINNIPEFIKEDYQNADFFVFLNMIGQHFDILWTYINASARNKITSHNKQLGIIDDMVYHMLEGFGWNTKRAFDSKFIWEYAFGLNKDGSQKYGMSLSDANQEVWRRILNNLPYLLKHKGTARAMKAIMACYGVPQSLLTIMEFGGPQNPTESGVTQFTFDDRTAAITLDETSAIKIPWHTHTADYPNCIEFRIKPSILPNTSYTLISGSEWSLDLVSTTGSYGKLELNFGGDQSVSTYFETSGTYYPYISTAIEYVYGPDYKTGSLDFPISTEYYSNVAINRYNSAGTGSWYTVWLATTNGDRITTQVSMSLFCIDNQWETGSTLQIGGNGYRGNIDEFRLWRVPLQRSKFNNHTLFPDAINGNSYTASTADLLFRLDFEYPKDRTADNSIKNVAINTTYGENYATASNFYSASSYPYQYEPYERTVTANVPSTGYSFGNKIRFEDIEIQTGKQLSHKVRATKKSFDRAPIDSNRLGLFFSPIKELNMDILKSFGDFNIDNYIGDPRDEYKDNYKELENLREYYFDRMDRNIYEYIQLVKYINKSLFDVLEDVAPARAKISKGLLIEPHFLERSKHAWKPVETAKLDYDGFVDVNENNSVVSTYEVKNAEFNAVEDIIFDNTYDTYDSVLNVDDVTILNADNATYGAEIVTLDDTLIETEYPTYPPTGSINIDCKFGATLIGQADSFKLVQIGMDPDSLANSGFGLMGKNGVAKVWGMNVWGNFTSSMQNVYIVKESYQERTAIQTEGWPATNIPGQQIKYGYQYVTKYKTKITKLPLGSPTLTTGSNIVEVTKLNGYTPAHYKFVNNLSEGLKRSYYKGSQQTSATTPDGLDPVEIFTTNPNILKVADTGRGSGEPILIVT